MAVEVRNLIVNARDVYFLPMPFNETLWAAHYHIRDGVIPGRRSGANDSGQVKHIMDGSGYSGATTTHVTP